MEKVEVIEKVKIVLENNKSNYMELFKTVKGKLEEFVNSDEGRQVLYRLMSRGDYQKEEGELKTAESIYKNIKKDIEQQEDSHLENLIYDFDDIIGFRLICIYPSDMKVIENLIRKEFNSEEFEIFKDPRKTEEIIDVAFHLDKAGFDTKRIADLLNEIESKYPNPKPEKWTEEDVLIKETIYKKRERSYRGLNYSVRPKGQKQYKCEIQILTMLHETWAFKTHDNIYKEENLTDEHKRQAKLLSDTLAVADEESELLKDEIEKKRAEIKIKRAQEAEIREVIYSSQALAERLEKLLKGE